MKRPMFLKKIFKKKKNKHQGSNFDDFLREEGIHEEVSKAAAERVDGDLKKLGEKIEKLHIDDEEGEDCIQDYGTSLEDVLQECKIDRNLWHVSHFNTKELRDGKFLWTVHFKKKGDVIDWDKFKEELKIYSPKVKKLNFPPQNKDLLLECSVFDTHLGKLSYYKETGQNYNIDIAYDLFSRCIDYAISWTKGFKIARIIFPIGQDFLHVDNRNNQTTAGTPQDSDSRATKIFTTGRQLLIESIEKLKKIAPVDVIALPGNHEENSLFHLADCIECRYWNDDNVTVDNSPTNRKYYQWGKNLIGVAHGDKNKVDDLFGLMPAESPKMWGETTYRYWRIGHYHHQKLWVCEKTGIIAEYLPSISATDFWHSGKGFVKNIRGTVSSIYDKDNGLVHKFYYNL